MFYCIYTITCKINNKIYIGYTNNFLNRKRQHLGFLRNNKHVNIHLQSSYNLYGEDNFEIEILIYCEKDHVFSEEHYWCNLLNTHNPNFGYNIASTNPNNIISVQSKEINEKRIKTLTGRKLSDSHVENLRKVRIGCINSEGSKIKVKKWFKENGHPSKGVKRSKEVRDKMSLSSKGKPKESRRKKLISIENESIIQRFESVKELTLYYGVSESVLYKNLKEKSSSMNTKIGVKIKVIYER